MSSKWSLLALALGFVICQSIAVESPASSADESTCFNDWTAPCYCSAKCGFRDKKQGEDDPVFVPNDSAGKFCYCKQWDLDNYEENQCELYEE